MLVLSRRIDERIVIGDDVVITVIAIHSDGKVRLGITAPIEIEVHRQEVYDEIQRKKQQREKGGHQMSTIASRYPASQRDDFPAVPLGPDDLIQPGDQFKGRSSGLWLYAEWTIGKTVAEACRRFGTTISYRRPSEAGVRRGSAEFDAM